jgi:hypothetical protein
MMDLKDTYYIMEGELCIACSTVLSLTLMNIWFCCQGNSLYCLTLLTTKGALISLMLHERVRVSTVRYLVPHLKHPASVAAHLYNCLWNKERMPSKVRHNACCLYVLRLTTLPLLQTARPNHMMPVNNMEMIRNEGVVANLERYNNNNNNNNTY